MTATTPRVTKVPAIPDVGRTPEAIDQVLRALKESDEVGRGRRGDPLDRFVTLRDLRDGGVAQVDGTGRVLGTAGGAPGSGAALPDEIEPPDYGDTDYTAPPKPRNVRARGMPPDTDPNSPEANSLGIVMLTWDAPAYGNHYYAEIYRMPRGAVPQDNTGAPLFDIGANGFRPAYAHGVDRGDGVLNTITGGGAVFVGVAAGTIFVDRGLPELPPQGNPVDAALSPGRYYYWIRFVSRAMVTGPVSDRAEATLSINPMRVLDAMTQNVTDTALFRHLREWLALGSEEAAGGGSILQYVDTQVEAGSIRSIWSVRMGQSVGGQVFTAGFGLGLETTRNPAGDWSSLSSFLVNANQFAIMGPNTTGSGALITHWSTLGADTITLQLATASHGFSVTTPRQRATLMIPTGQVRVAGPDPENPTIVSVPYSPWAGAELEVVSVFGNTVTLTSAIDTRQPQNDGTPSFATAPSQAVATEWQCALMPGSNIPFIVDTARSVVGIRGSLVVDGLVRATEGEFDTLVANTAFVRKLQAEVVNANVVIGQRIIAGVPGSGSIDLTDYEAISNYIVELNNPVTNPFPLRFWKPSTGHTVFSVSNLGNLFVGGHMTVGGSAVIAGEANDGTDVIFSTGGSGADTGPSSRYALWLGQRGAYGSAGEGRSEANGLFWVKSNGRAGFNADVFLGEEAFTLPMLAAGNQSGSGTFIDGEDGIRAQTLVTSAVTDSSLTVRPLRSGAASTVMVTVSGQLIRTQPSNNNGDTKRFRLTVQLVGSPGASSGSIVQELEMDDWKPETWAFNVSGVLQLPAGDYYVRVDVANLNPSSGEMSIIRGWNAIVMQVTGQGGLTATAPISFRPPAGLDPLPPSEELIMGPDHIEAGEDILKGKFVNIYDDGGAKIRHADASLGRRADGFLLESCLLGDKIKVHTEGINPWLVAKQAGETYALSHTDPGDAVELGSATTTSGHIVQVLGRALTDTALDVELGEPVTRK